MAVLPLSVREKRLTYCALFRNEPRKRGARPHPPHAARDNETLDHLLSIVETGSNMATQNESRKRYRFAIGSGPAFGL